MKEVQGEKNAMLRILTAATSLFAVKGYSGVSVKELAEAAGVNIAAVSYYFGGKENLYVSVMDQQFADINAMVAQVKQPQLSAIEKIRLLGELVLQIHERWPYFNQLVLSETVTPNEFYLEKMSANALDFRDLLRTVLMEGITSGELRHDFDPGVAALALVSLMQYYFTDRDFSNVFLDEGPDRAEYYIRNAIELFLRGIVKPEASD